MVKIVYTKIRAFIIVFFAKEAIEKGRRVIQYKGEKISKDESAKRALEWEENAKKSGEGLVYIFELDDDWDLDGRVGKNPARYINHSCEGNCEAVNDGGEIWIYSVADIAKGEELNYDYGYDMNIFSITRVAAVVKNALAISCARINDWKWRNC